MEIRFQFARLFFMMLSLDLVRSIPCGASSMNSAVRHARTIAWAALFALVSAVCLVGCTEARLKKEAPETAEDFDNQLRIKGRYCTERSGEVSFPVKVLYIVDQSASLQCTDSGQRRFGALRSSIDALRQRPNTEFAFIGFSSWSREVGFTRNRDDVSEFLDPNQGLGPATDYQGAIATAVRLIESDMLEVGPSERARTRYQVVFVSDGIPDPRCIAGCEDANDPCTDGEDNDGDGIIDANDPDCDNIEDNSLHPDNLYGVCNTDQEIPDDVYVDMSGICPAYNQPPQIRRRIEELLTLKDTYSVGGVTLNSVLLFSPQNVVEQVCPDASASFGYDKAQAEALLRGMARQGNGTFRDVNVDTDDDFLRFDITSLKAEQTLTAMMANNIHLRRQGDELLVDTDHDGLADITEREISTDPLSADSDGDHYHDLFEEIFRKEGFDPADDTKPALSCDDDDDRDQDGLNGCEESFIGTSTLLADSDGDDLLDWHEMRHGTDPLVADAHGDLEFDGVENGDEIRGGTEPALDDAEVFRTQRIVYGLDDLGLVEVPRGLTGEDAKKTDERHCYDFDIRRLSLVVTPVPRQRGLNRILLYANERPARVGGVTGETRVACFEAYYDGAQVKSPASGVIDVTQESLDGVRTRLAAAFDELQTCAYFGRSTQETGTDAGTDEPVEPLGRDEIEEMITSCMPPKIALDRRLYEQGELIDMLESNVAGDLSPKLPELSHELFVPIQNFRADRDCFRPWEFERVEHFVDKMEVSCGKCSQASSQDDGPDAGSP
jgi:hypothetical protein